MSPNTLLLAAEGGCNGRCLSLGRYQVVDDILDEDSLALFEDEYASSGMNPVPKRHCYLHDASSRRSGTRGS